MRGKLIIGVMAFLCVSCGRAVSVLDSDFKLDHVLEVEGRQGVATDGDFYYISGSTALYKYDMEGNLVARNEAPFKDLQLECNHIGDIDEYDGEIFAGCEYFLDGVGKNIQTAIYDAKTLEYKRSIPWVPESGQVECCGLTVDRDRKEVWMADWVQGSELYCYDLKTGMYLRNLTLSPAPRLQQGIYCVDGQMLVSCDDGDAEKDEPDNLYKVDLETGEVTLFRTMDDFILTGEIEGLTMNPKNGNLIVMSNRGARIILGMPKGFYPGYDREIHNIYIYTPENNNER